MKKFSLITAAVAFCIVCIVTGVISIASGAETHLKKTEQALEKEAEVSPGVWLTYQEYRTKWASGDTSWGAIHGLSAEERKFWQTDSEWMSIPWQGKHVTWLGVGEPICLRAWKDELYLIVFDRDSVPVNEARFRFYGETHGVLAEIAAKDFPREIATQNLWLSTNNGYRDGKAINEVEIVKALDPASIDFQDSLTANIWRQCETGKEYDAGHAVEQALLDAYLKKYAVVRLLEIQRHATSQPSK